MDDEVLKLYGYVIISTYRYKTVESLKEDVKTPTQISSETGIRSNHISKVLKELKEKGIAECINEDYKKGRLYRLTEVGNEIAKKI